jgi:hypothetical protein
VKRETCRRARERRAFQPCPPAPLPPGSPAPKNGHPTAAWSKWLLALSPQKGLCYNRQSRPDCQFSVGGSRVWVRPHPGVAYPLRLSLPIMLNYISAPRRASSTNNVLRINLLAKVYFYAIQNTQYEIRNNLGLIAGVLSIIGIFVFCVPEGRKPMIA